MRFLKYCSIFLFFHLSFQSCISNIFDCPMDTIALKTECQAKKDEEKNKLLLLALALSGTKNGSNTATLSGDEAPIGQLSGNTQAMINQINNNSKCSSSKIEENSNLTKTAQNHSYDMVTRSFFSHVNPDGNNPAVRLKNSNIGGLTSFSSDPLTAWNKAGYNTSTYESSSEPPSGNGYGTSNGVQKWEGAFELITRNADTADEAYNALKKDLAYSYILTNFCNLGLTHIGIGKNSNSDKDSNKNFWTIIMLKSPSSK
ncbi:MAG: hypothetical protein H7A25_08855 [Leptospiraceae bacterium]|nr:hypothetical protein [Leptospiraceae bacterium]MCP5499999.1 hypothetical protein [Leptospiraceae bacterium]